MTNSIMSRKHIFALTLLVFFAAVAPARADKTDDFIKAEMQKQNIPGLSLAVVQGLVHASGGESRPNPTMISDF